MSAANATLAGAEMARAAGPMGSLAALSDDELDRQIRDAKAQLQAFRSLLQRLTAEQHRRTAEGERAASRSAPAVGNSPGSRPSTSSPQPPRAQPEDRSPQLQREKQQVRRQVANLEQVDLQGAGTPRYAPPPAPVLRPGFSLSRLQLRISRQRGPSRRIGTQAQI